MVARPNGCESLGQRAERPSHQALRLRHEASPRPAFIYFTQVINSPLIIGKGQLVSAQLHVFWWRLSPPA
ncbi:protein of unknown function [Stenotrophomonas maltophilia]|nr:protein of unknown function [Stenotrophomonas maltophilia]